MSHTKSFYLPRAIMTIQLHELNRCTCRKVFSEVIYDFLFPQSFLSIRINPDIGILNLTKILTTILGIIDTDTDNDFLNVRTYFRQFHIDCFCIALVISFFIVYGTNYRYFRIDRTRLSPHIIVAPPFSVGNNFNWSQKFPIFVSTKTLLGIVEYKIIVSRNLAGRIHHKGGHIKVEVVLC